MDNYCGSVDGAPWDAERWPDFSLEEIVCKCGCREVYVDPIALDALQKLRNKIGGPIRIASGHRCSKHNAEEGGQPHSVHLQLAFDIALSTYARGSMLALARDAGFKRFGLMLTALHCDTHPIDATHAEMWTYGPKSCAAWHGLFPISTPDIGGL